MIDLILASALYISPLPMQDASSAVRVVNISAARQARQIPKEWEAFTLCISERESGYGNDHPSKSYRAKNPASSASGRYQFLDTSWRQGGAWNVWKRLIRNGYDRATAKYVRMKLMATPMREWRPVYQDILYAEVILSGEGKGWRHWYLAESECNSKVPK
jgi:hypothetical protein